MRIVRYRMGRTLAHGVLDGHDIFDLEGNVFAEPRRGCRVAAHADVTLLAPCQPGQIVSVGANYVDRCVENELPVPTEPGRHDSFRLPGECIIGPEASIRVPPSEAHVHYGAELGVVMRRDCHGVAADAIAEYVLGYTCVNNVWAKSRPRVPGVLNIRLYESFCPVGPWIETDLDPRDLALQLRLNGKTRQASRTSRMIFDVFTIVAFVAGCTRLRAGDLIMTATPSGVDRLQAGDRVEVEIEGIGVLANPVVADAGVPQLPLERL